MLVGPITETTRGTYLRALRKRHADERAGSAPKKPRLAHTPSPSTSSAAKPTRPTPRRKPHILSSSSRMQPGSSELQPPPKSPPRINAVPPLTFNVDGDSPDHEALVPRVVPAAACPAPKPSSPPSYFKRNLDFSPSASEVKRTPPVHTPPSPQPSSPPSSPNSSGGLLSVVTGWIEAGVKKIADQFQPLATPRRALQRRSSLFRREQEKHQSPTSPPRRNASYDESIPIDEVDMQEESPGPSGSGVLPKRPPPVRKSAPSPPQKATPSSYDWELLPSDVEICLKADGTYWKLGKGGFGEVFKGIKDGIDEVAVKVIRLQASSFTAVAQFKQEIDMISKLRHRHILQFYGACVQPNCLYMVTELMQTDLFSALRKDPRYLWTGTYGKVVVEGIASGLHYLHSRRPPVVHRDIKSPNVLLMDSTAKIADVGIARTKAASDMTAQIGFTAAWAAPEVVYRQRATEKIDIWSLGVIIWEVVTGNLPKPGHLALPQWAPLPLLQLYMQCIEREAERRPDAAEVVQRLKQM